MIKVRVRWSVAICLAFAAAATVVAGANTITVVATDQAGNATTIVLTVDF